MPEGEGSAALAASRSSYWSTAPTSRRGFLVGSAAGVAAGWLLVSGTPVEAAALPHAVFAGLIGDRFQVTPPDAGPACLLELIELTESQPLVTWLDGRRVALRGSATFTLTFRGPTEPALPQATYRFAHDTVGAFALFIVPMARTETEQHYAAVFNRLAG